ncbi:ABC transporter substrate-binding protein [Halorubrum sp. Atlit-8R]|uniref:ABC transporter substrate-binding protein n=1 Tax=unclassified Halorubrum TaxID=2642239 RepID=UPI000EF20B0A|nr:MULTISPECIES: ABC transporter substrate-binding protein [unclassified Halorubrum]RLM71330.1 ABC transporter substrate-binding protein [Halorubrum sp. Atlit-9R]RLM72198.1 ABC transporter substrate-binding protein [Halorubrum sp. Atlit-9R]RLM82517.1 ABC transporter substrate-binding protein [Halorubrum sp. Atlit-8R]
MADERPDRLESSRRDYVKYGAAVGVGGLLAGCTSDAGNSSGATDDGPETENETTEGDDGGTTSAEESTEDTGYSVTMSPAGTVEFDAVPETAAVYSNHDADILVSLGQSDVISSLGFPENYSAQYYDELPGVSLDTSALTKLYDDGVDKEVFYELDSDVHHIDPVWMSGWSSFDESDFDEIESNIAPFFANYHSRTNIAPDSASDYQFYTIWELVDKYAQAYQVPERGAELKAVRDEMVADIRADLPPQSERPEVGVVWYDQKKESFWVYHLNEPGFQNAHTRPLRANDALSEFDSGPRSGWSDSALIDMEAMLDADPDVLLHFSDWQNPDGATEAFFALDEHPVGKELTAVENDRLYASGDAFQGPIINIFQIELTAKQIYPDLFGEPPEPGNTGGLGEMFDPQRVADIVNGDI